MKNRKLKKPVIYTGYALGFVLLVALIYLIEGAVSNAIFKPRDEDYDYISETIIDDDIPVVSVKDKIARPYIDSEVKIVKNFYDYQAEAKKQESSLIFHSDTYFQNSGIAYGGKENFNVLAILEGTVVDVKEDPLLGKIIEIRHGNELISVYQSLSETIVKKDDIVKQGDIIGKSGKSNFGSDLNDHLHLELIHKGIAVNPENFYDKKLTEL